MSQRDNGKLECVRVGDLDVMLVERSTYVVSCKYGVRPELFGF